MKREDILALVDNVEEYVKNANVDELTGRIFRLNVDLQKQTGSKQAAPIALELALVVAFIEEKEDGR